MSKASGIGHDLTLVSWGQDFMLHISTGCFPLQLVTQHRDFVWCARIQVLLQVARFMYEKSYKGDRGSIASRLIPGLHMYLTWEDYDMAHTLNVCIQSNRFQVDKVAP